VLLLFLSFAFAMTKTSEFLPYLFQDRMKLILGDDYQKFREAMDQDTPVSVRINPEKFPLKPALEPVPWCKTGYYLRERPVFTTDPWLHAGAYYVQEPSSMFLEVAFHHIAGTGKPLLVLDLCGAPGGKSTHLLSLLNRGSLLVSNEVIRSRASVLNENLAKWGYANSIVTSNDPSCFAESRNLFDIVVVDAPCSGEGLFRKDRSAISEWSPENTNLCSARQKRIISSAWECIKPGGYLIYSTCTWNPEENEKNLEWLAGMNGGISVEIPVSDFNGIRKISTGNVTGYSFLPHLIKGEGFFTGVLQKTDGSGVSVPRIKKSRYLKADKNQIGKIENWILPEDELTVVQDKNQLVLFPEDWVGYLNFFSTRLNIVNQGCPIAEMAGTDLNPKHSFALSVNINKKHFIRLDLSHQQALQYLRRETFMTESLPKGWILVSYRQIPIGWIKNLGNRFNNYYPSEWRIRMQVTTASSNWHDVSA
jgi:16S rRNA C967 or C1407 C5-methylase (RsmB/RsmF family)/NOL1/NOP2/fmu family ribosome biogenesis protein